MLRLCLRMHTRLPRCSLITTTVTSTTRVLATTLQTNASLYNKSSTTTVLSKHISSWNNNNTSHRYFSFTTKIMASSSPSSSSSEPLKPPSVPTSQQIPTETTLKPTDIVMIYVTVPSKDVGRTIAHTLCTEKLAACTNIIPGLESIYFWDGKVNTDEELLLLIKSRASLLPELTKRVKEMHPYKDCEVVAVPIVGGGTSYLQWVRESTEEEIKGE